MDLTIKWQGKDKKWNDFQTSDIMYQSRNHAINLFSQGTAVVIKQDEQYIVNTQALFNQYKRQGKPVKLLSECEGAEGLVEEVGFI